jgi:predicted Zn-dependent protease
MKRIFGLVVALALSAAPMAAQSKNEKDIQDIGHRGVGTGINFYSLEKEIALGKMLAEEVESTARMVDDPVINEYVNRVAQNLVRNSDAHVPFTVHVVDSPDINAFALPGGFFFVNTGLILAADEESELAGVMAHEIAHVAARHGTRNATKAEIVNYATLPLIFIGGPIGFAGRSAASVAVPVTFLRFSRGAEREADYLGLQYMYKAGYDPQAYITFFEKIQAKEKSKKGAVAKAFSTHPQTPDRIAASEKEISTVLPARSEYVVTTSEFDSVKARLARIEHQYQTQDKLHGSDRPTLEKSQQKKDKNGKKGSDDDRPVLKPRPED